MQINGGMSLLDEAITSKNLAKAAAPQLPSNTNFTIHFFADTKQQQISFDKYKDLPTHIKQQYLVFSVSGFWAKDHIENGKKLFSTFQENLT